MKNAKIFIIIAAIAALFTVSVSSFAAKADEDLKAAAKIVAKGDAAKSSEEKNEYYKDAVGKYGKIMRAHKKSVAGLEAKFALSEVYEKYTGDKNHLQKAYDNYKQIENLYYGVSDAQLKETFSDDEVARVRKIVSETEKRKAAVAVKIDEKNRGNILYRIMDTFVQLTGAKPTFSYWFAIVLVTVFVKIVISPLTKAQFKTMKQMQEISPLLKEVQKKYEGDQQAIGEKTMELYKKYNINPFASCLPILIQMPILWVLYYMIKCYEMQFEKGTFLWIGSAMSHASGFLAPLMEGTRVWFSAKNLAEPDLILVVLYLISMYVSTKMSAVDPTQADQQKMMSVLMPIMFAFIFIGFPAAFLLYWLIFNVLNTVQQYYIINGGTKIDPKSAEAAAVINAPLEGDKDKGENKKDGKNKNGKNGKKK